MLAATVIVFGSIFLVMGIFALVLVFRKKRSS